MLDRPLVLHEQNSIAGLANRVLAQVADRLLVAFPGVLSKSEWTGNPVRREIAELPAPEQRFRDRSGNLKVLVVGGSLGAQALNETVPRALALIPEIAAARQSRIRPARSIWPRSRANYREARRASATLLAFIDDMAGATPSADLVICRAGALTVSELAAAGVASVLVPFPHAVDDHQTSNARYLVGSDPPRCWCRRAS